MYSTYDEINKSEELAIRTQALPFDRLSSLYVLPSINMARTTPLLWILSFFSAIFLPTAAGQYLQDWAPGSTVNGVQSYWWRPSINSQYGRIQYWDSTAVYLVYNCYYMTAICENARNFLNTPRGQARQPHPQLFAYDFGRRTTRRRQRSCPSSWAGAHRCPEVNQPTVWRQDGAWWYTDLDPVQVSRHH